MKQEAILSYRPPKNRQTTVQYRILVLEILKHRWPVQGWAKQQSEDSEKNKNQDQVGQKTQSSGKQEEAHEDGEYTGRERLPEG